MSSHWRGGVEIFSLCDPLCACCRDIKQLDFAKRHLQTTITALKRLHMLVSAVDQLSFFAREHHYKEAANLVDAVRQVRHPGTAECN